MWTLAPLDTVTPTMPSSGSHAWRPGSQSPDSVRNENRVTPSAACHRPMAVFAASGYSVLQTGIGSPSTTFLVIHLGPVQAVYQEPSLRWRTTRKPARSSSPMSAAAGGTVRLPSNTTRRAIAASVIDDRSNARCLSMFHGSGTSRIESISDSKRASTSGGGAVPPSAGGTAKNGWSPLTGI